MRRLLLAIAIAALPWISAAQKPTAKVEQGLLQGTVEEGLTVYRGIPFAAPPVGDLRWRAPEPAAKWNGVRQADKFAPQCVQGNLGPAPPPGPPPPMSEDCLYLNVWTPAKSASDRIPVFVWIYGGGFNAGATLIPLYSGEVLAHKGVVLVSIAYRVGNNFAGAQPESLMVRADGYRILIGRATTIAWDPPPNSLAAVVPGDWIEYKGKQRADGIIEAESAKLSRTFVSDSDEKLHKKYDFVDPNDPTKGVRVFAGIIRPYPDAAMQARVSAIGGKLIPAYQHALPDTDPAKINFRFLVVDKKHWHDALTLSGGIILVPRQVVERMQNDSQLATVLADNISCLLEKQPDRDLPASEELTAVGVGADVVGIFVPGAGLAATAAGVSEEEMMIKAEHQSGRVSLGLLRDAGYDINQAPIAWWLLAANKPEPTSSILLPHRAAYVYRAIGENWQTIDIAPPKP